MFLYFARKVNFFYIHPLFFISRLQSVLFLHLLQVYTTIKQRKRAILNHIEQMLIPHIFSINILFFAYLFIIFATTKDQYRVRKSGFG